MTTTHINADGSLVLGEAARQAGYGPGAVVRVIVTRAGSVILALDDTPATIEATSRRALRSGRRAIADRRI